MPVPIFIDRDGTLIEEAEHLATWDKIRFVPGAPEAVAAANRAGHPVVIITNQSGVARGYFTEQFVIETGKHLNALLAPFGAHLDGYYYCPHHVEGKPPYAFDCPDRKPKSGMVERAAKDLGLTLRGAYMIGDRAADVELGAHLGIRPILVRTGYGKAAEAKLAPDFASRGGRVFDTLPEALAWILRQAPDTPASGA